MKTNSYTMAIDRIHVSESMIEAALAAAKLRAAKTAAAQTKVRYAAVAASVVLAGAASAAYFSNIAGFKPPVSPAPAAPTAIATDVEATEAATTQGSVPATQAHTESTEKQRGTEHSQETIYYSATRPTQEETAAGSSQTATDAPKATEAPRPAPTHSAPTVSAATEPATEPQDVPLPEIDRSLLCADGKLYITVAETGLEYIDDPAAFSDDHVYYIETKFGRFYQIKPFEIKHIDLSLNNDKPKSDEMVYLYNDDGEIVGQAPVWW
ncbi:MAG: hypothetical protein IJH07_04025 [Ruminococcus sp.]|nr:hypothetical protein [Ruminococcus sp.]